MKLLMIKILLVLLSIAVLWMFGFAAGEAWDHDGYAHSRAAFGDEYEYQGE